MPSGWPAIGSCVTTNDKRLSEFPEIKLLGKGYLSKPVNGIVIGMSAGDVSKCVVTWNSSTSDQHINLPNVYKKIK